MNRQEGEERAARAACRLLLSAGKPQCPVDVRGLIGLFPDVRLTTYRQLEEAAGKPLGSAFFTAPSDSAFTAMQWKKGGLSFLILYNDDPWYTDERRTRFSLAHELGHILLHHRGDAKHLEREACVFARLLLCPRPLLRRTVEEGAGSPVDIAAVFQVHYSVARLALEDIRTGAETRYEPELARLYRLDSPLFGDTALGKRIRSRREGLHAPR